MGMMIMRRELPHLWKSQYHLKKKQIPGSNDLKAELLKYGGEKQSYLWKLVENIWVMETIPDWDNMPHL